SANESDINNGNVIAEGDRGGSSRASRVGYLIARPRRGCLPLLGFDHAVRHLSGGNGAARGGPPFYFALRDTHTGLICRRWQGELQQHPFVQHQTGAESRPVELQTRDVRFWGESGHG